MKKYITTYFASCLIEEVTKLSATISSNEKLGLAVREYIINSPNQELSSCWWDEIIPFPPKLEDKFIHKIMFYASKRLTNEEVGVRIRKFTLDYWNKPGHTLLWSKLSGDIR